MYEWTDGRTNGRTDMRKQHRIINYSYLRHRYAVQLRRSKRQQRRRIGSTNKAVPARPNNSFIIFGLLCLPQNMYKIQLKHR